MKIILTHDVDSMSKPLTHIIRRWRRFTIKDLLLHVFGFQNLYNNISDIIALEEEYGFRSTFFLPVVLFPLAEVEDLLREITVKQWEIALHFVVEKFQLKSLVKMEKDYLEDVVGKIYGVRTHMLAITERLSSIYKEAGFLYDSSYRVEEAGKYDLFKLGNGLVEIPIAIMDADLFGRLRLSEEKAWKYIIKKIAMAEAERAEYFTILFHQESFKMKGGRLYKRLVRYIGEKGYEVLRCIDAVKGWSGSV